MEIKSLDDLYRLAQFVVKARVAPNGMSESGVLIAMQTGMELGFTPMRALQACPVINNVAGLRGNAGIALLRNSGVLDERLDYQCRCDVDDQGKMYGWARSWRKGWPEPRESFFTEEDAKTAGLTSNSNYKKYPKRMLQWRAVGFHNDDNYSDITLGLQPPEVLYSYEPERELNAPLPDETDVGAQGPDPLLAGLLDPVDADVVEAETPVQEPTGGDEGGPLVIDPEDLGEVLDLNVSRQDFIDAGGPDDWEGPEEYDQPPAEADLATYEEKQGTLNQSAPATARWLDDATNARGVYLKQRCGVQDPETDEPCRMAFGHSEDPKLGPPHSWQRDEETGDVLPPELGGPGA
jgi:hypothetical protein